MGGTKKKRCDDDARGTAAAASTAGAGCVSAVVGTMVAGLVITSVGISRRLGGTSSLGCMGVQLIRLAQRARTVLPQKVRTYSPLRMSSGLRAHLIWLPRRKVLKTRVSSASGFMATFFSEQAP